MIFSTPVSAQVYLNEVMPNPGDAQDASEWIELYNSSNFSQSLDTYLLNDAENGSNPFSLQGQSLEPFSFLIIPKSLSKLQLNNDGDVIRLIGPDNQILDSYSYTSTQSDISYGRIPDGSGDWQAISNPSPGKSNYPGSLTPTTTINLSPSYQPTITASPTQSNPNITFSEIYACASNTDKEWIELYNPNPESIDLTGWMITDASENQINLDNAIDKFAYRIIELPRPIINNSGDTLYLKNPTSQIIDQAEFSVCSSQTSWIPSDYGWSETLTLTPGQPNIFKNVSSPPMLSVGLTITPTKKSNTESVPTPVSKTSSILPEESSRTLTGVTSPHNSIEITPHNFEASVAGIVRFTSLSSQPTSSGSSSISPNNLSALPAPIFLFSACAFFVAGALPIIKRQIQQ